MSEPADDAWAGERVARWLRQSAALERQLAPLSEILFDDAALRPGERVLDVGCGDGPTTVDAARRVGPTGRAVGLDVSPEMLARAAERAASLAGPEGVGAIEWVCADVATWEPEAVHDVVLSRFGVMFFDDPRAAFAALRRATASGGRLRVLTWSRRDASDLFGVPLRAVTDVVRARGGDPVVLPDDGGPFSLGDPATVAAVLTDAGWHGIAVDEHVCTLPYGGGLAPEPAADFALEFGPSRLALADVDPATRAAAREALVEVLAGHTDDEGHVWLGASVRSIGAT